MMFRPLMALLFLAPATITAQDDPMGILRSIPTDGRTLAVGQSQEGRLTSDDPRLFGDGPQMQAWIIQPAAGQTVTIDLMSDDFDALLLLVGPGMTEPLRDDDGGSCYNSRITHAFTGEEYRVIVSSFSGTAGASPSAAFTLRAALGEPPLAETEACSSAPGEDFSFEGDGNEWADVTVDMLNALPLAGRLRRGDSTAGVLNAGSPELGDARHGLAYEVSGPAGGAVTIDLASVAFDTYLFVVHANHAEPLTDDDAGGACNSRITVTLPESGRVRVVASSFGSGAEGAFTLGASQEPPPARPGSCGTTSRFDVNAIAALAAAGRIALGESREGELTPDDQQVGAYYADVWEITGRAGEMLVVELLSAEFDAYLGFTGPGIVNALTDDDGAGQCNSRLTVTIPEAGTFRIIATTFRDGATGTYTLRVGREAGPEGEGGCNFARESRRLLRELPVRGTLEVGGTVSGRLDDTSPILSSGSFATAYTLEVRADEVYTVDLNSGAFDTFLFAISPSGLITEDDDCGAGTDSRLVLQADERGDWRIVASSFTSAEGPYTITVTSGEPAHGCGEDPGWTDEGVDYDEAPVIGHLQVGDEYRGELTADDVRHYDGSSMQAFEFTGRAGDRATVDLVSPVLDAYLIVMGRGLDEMLTDDDSGGACNSRITFTVPESGSYRIIVNTLMAEQYGPYVLRVSAVEGPVTPGDCESP